MKAKDMYELLAVQGIRIFVLDVPPVKMTYIHPQKTTKEWRSDLREIFSEVNRKRSGEGLSDDYVYNEVLGRLSEAGYLEVDDLASDVYEGRIAPYPAGIEDAPIHADQADGFGHYGWECEPEK